MPWAERRKPIADIQSILQSALPGQDRPYLIPLTAPHSVSFRCKLHKPIRSHQGGPISVIEKSSIQYPAFSIQHQAFRFGIADFGFQIEKEAARLTNSIIKDQLTTNSINPINSINYIIQHPAASILPF